MMTKGRKQLCHYLRKNHLQNPMIKTCLLYTSDAADEEDSVDLGGRRIIKTKKKDKKQRAEREE